MWKITKEELEKEATEWVIKNSGYSKNEFHDRKAIETYIASAEPREKQIQALGGRCLQLQEDKGRLTDELAKAKEVIGELFHYVPSWTGKENGKVYAMPDGLRAKAEQFLNIEVEKWK